MDRHNGDLHTLLRALERNSLNTYRGETKVWSKLKHQTPWSESEYQLHRPSDRRLSAKLVPTFVDRGCHVVSVTDPYGRTVF
jgi:hypothetical protein